jgi:ribosomal protein S27AE
MRLIDADELKKFAIPCEIHNGASTDLCIPLYQIDNAPTIIWCSETSEGLPLMDLRPRQQGEWVIIDEDHTVSRFKICSNCGKEAEWLDGGSQLLSKFCPNCGAKMKGGAECQ